MLGNRTKHRTSVELFLAVGLAATMGACGGGHSANPDQTMPPTHGVTSAQGDGGEGGETGHSGDPNRDYMTNLALMKGHLLVAQELLAAGKPAQAELHIGHPAAELYGGIEMQLTALQAPPFKAELTTLHDLVKSAPASPQIAPQLQRVNQTIDGAMAAIPASDRQSPEFMVSVIQQTLNTAAAEYRAAIADNKIVAVVEYQDSRGFVLYADRLYRGLEKTMTQGDRQRYAMVQKNLAVLKTVWPGVVPPATPVKTPEEVQSLIAQIAQKS